MPWMSASGARMTPGGCNPQASWTLLLLSWIALGVSVEAADAPRRPNVIFILLDNCGQEWLGCYGSEENATPNIDALARDGLRFEHCYTPPVCGPSRMTLLTGRYLLRSGFTLHHDAALYRGGGFDPAREIVFARLLRSAGYATGIAGKWQINNLYDEPDVLARHGFNEHLVWPGSVDRDRVTDAERREFEAGIAANSVPVTNRIIQKIESRYWDPVLLRNGQREVQRGRFGPDVLQEFALDFIRRHRGEPFLLYYPMVLTHGQTNQQSVVGTPPNRDPSGTEHDAYAGMVRYADRLVGELVKSLEDLGLRDDTLVFVATDNGTESKLTARANGRLVQGGLYTLTEAGGDVALLVNCPKRVPGGRTSPLADFSDILPTICEATGAALPADLVIDGRSFASVMRGDASEPHRDWIFNQYHNRRTVRDARFKLYSTGEFYDVAADRDEKNNLADSRDAAVVAAREKLSRVLASMPPNSPPPFVLRSQSAFKIRSEP